MDGIFTESTWFPKEDYIFAKLPQTPIPEGGESQRVKDLADFRS